MANLFWKTPDGVKALLDTPFGTEDEFEKTVFETSELLEDIFLLKRQVRGGSKSGIPDIVGVDNDGNVCIIEMKNKQVDSAIIPQVLQYAFWAETNPDSIKSLWLECDSRPDDVTMPWDSLQVRILVIAPSIHISTLDLVDKINYPVDLIEVKRWMEAENELLLVNKLESEPKKPTKPVTGHTTYDEAFYKTLFNNKSVDHFLKYARDLERQVKKQKWDLQIKFNKNYVGFKAGFFNAFGIEWVGSKSFAFFVKLPQEECSNIEKIPMTRYQAQWKQGLYYIEPGRTKATDYIPLFEAAYKRLSGK